MTGNAAPDVADLLRTYVDGHRRPVTIDEATTVPLAGITIRPRRAARALAFAALGLAAAGTVAVAGIALERAGSDDPQVPALLPEPPAPSMNTVASTPPTTTAAHEPPDEVAVLVAPEQLGEIALEAVGQHDALVGPFELRETQRRTRDDGTPYSWAYLSGTAGRLFVEAYATPLDIAGNPPYPGNVIAVEDGNGFGTTWVWPVDPAFNTVAVVGEHQTIVVRSETFEVDPPVGLFGDQPVALDGSTARTLTFIATDVMYRIAEASGATLRPPPTPEVPEGTTLVGLMDLDQPGERVLVTDYHAAIEGGPVVGLDGRTYGNQEYTEPDPETAEVTMVSSPDFIAIMHPEDPRQVIVGFFAADSMVPGAATKVQLIYGITGDVVGFFRQIDVTDANGVYLSSKSEFEQLPADGTLSVATAPELAVHDRNGDGTLSREELHATADALRRVIRGHDGTQGNVYASDLEPFLASMAGVEDPTSGAVSVIVPFFDLALNPVGEIDLGAADTVIFDDAGQPIGGWGSG